MFDTIGLSMLYLILTQFFPGHEDLIPNTGLDLGIIFAMDMIAVLCKHCVHLFNTKEGILLSMFLN